MFVVQHQHPADQCPARDPEMGPMLLRFLSDDTAAQHGVTVQSKAVVDNAHTLYLIVDAPSADAVQRFMAPFAQVGSVEVLPSSPCEEVVARRGCAAA